MLASEIIRRKRDGFELSRAEIEGLIGGLVSEDVSEGQAAAFAMAVYFKGMNNVERVALTCAMRDSGRRLDWDLPGPIVDKHSTGGVGDNVSLVLAPALAACGVYVPMISGRGLGHTGGTLDKLQAISGYDISPDEAKFRRTVGEVGCAIIGQTADLAPADKRLYAIRDVTATVDSVDLITASILSKKLAAGLDALVLDVKCGAGAFMADASEASALARALVDVANGAGLSASALVTDMNEPLASAAGNALEVSNACSCLAGAEIDGRLWDVTVALGGELLRLAGASPDARVGASRISEALESGAAADRFGRMVAALGGASDLIETWAERLPAAPVVRDIHAAREGFVEGVDGRALGLAVIGLGGGRRRPTDSVDPRVGFDQLAGIGALVDAGAPIGRVHAADEAAADAAAAALEKAYRICDAAPSPREPVIARVEVGGER